eukprot:scaffold79511_cov22-Tisochrysis_lutea.AAC.1
MRRSLFQEEWEGSTQRSGGGREKEAPWLARHALRSLTATLTPHSAPPQPPLATPPTAATHCAAAHPSHNSGMGPERGGG